jgi:hypothetical protein
MIYIKAFFILVGFILALAVLVYGLVHYPWIGLAFPLWGLLFSVYMLIVEHLRNNPSIKN